MSTATKTRQVKNASKKPGRAKKQPPVVEVVKKPARRKVVEPEPEPVDYASLTQRRYQIQDHVASGKATLGNVVEQFGASALRTIARHTRFGRWQIAGIKPDSPAHLDPVADVVLAEKLGKLKPATAIKQLVAPPRRK